MSTDISKEELLSIAINANGTRLAFGDKNGMLRIMDIRTSSSVQNIPAHSARITNIEFSPDGQQIATSSMDKTAKIWNATDFSTPPIVITKHNTLVMSLAFSSDGNYLVTASLETSKGLSSLYYWPTHASYMADQMCDELTRNMTVREWETYVSYDLEYAKTCPNLP